MAKRKGEARERNESAQPGPEKCERNQPRLEAQGPEAKGERWSWAGGREV